MALYAVSDIHGYYGLFNRLLEAADYSPSRDRLVVLGDLIDRGPESRKVIDLCMDLQEKGAVIMKGNHEEMAVRCLDKSQNYSISINDWIMYCGGGAMINCYIDNNSLDTQTIRSHLRWLRNLPVYHQSYGYTFVHAGLRPNLPLKYQLESTMLWGCDEFIRTWNGPEVLVVGHAPVQSLQKNVSLPIIGDHVTFIDCGSFFSSKLTLVELPTDAPDLSRLRYCQVSKGGHVLYSA